MSNSTSNNVFGDFSNFFSQLGSLSTPDQINAFFQQYWYVWLIISIGVVVLIVLNVLICCYFRHHKKLNEIDPKTGEKRLYNKDWGVIKPTQTLFVPIEQNKQEGVENPLMIEEYDDSKFAIEALMEHNQYRLQHNAPPLQANEYLNRAATDWARQLVKMNQLKHSPDQWRRYQGSVLGENLAYFIGPVLKGENMTKMWYREVREHDFTRDLQEKSLHFSQLVWHNTKEVGFGRCQTADKKQWYLIYLFYFVLVIKNSSPFLSFRYGVALYYPPGNFPNQYTDNVHPRNDLEDHRLV